MPKVDIYGTQQPIAFLRLLIEKGGMYERGVAEATVINWLKVTNTSYLGAFCPPSIGRNPVDPRFVSLFNVFNLTFPSDESLKKIFGSILKTHLKPFSQPIRDLCSIITEFTINVYKIIVEKLPPTPSKFHYVFNLRDISRLFEGICQSTIDHFKTEVSFMRLWRNECSRVFLDRLNTKKDKRFVRTTIDEMIQKKFAKDYNSIVKIPSVFGDFNINFKSKEIVRLYNDMEDYSTIRTIVEDKLEEYNEINEKPLDLVLFDNALEHLTRIHRIIRINSGHALLIGVGGSGKKSLVKLATYLAGYKVFQLNIVRGYNEICFRDEMKELLNKLGVENKKIVFLFTDSDVIDECFLEYLNNLLTSGYIPALFETEEKDVINQNVVKRASKEGIVPTKENLWKFFLSTCKKNLHVVITMSPNEDLKNRCRSFPGLINNTKGIIPFLNHA